MGVGVEKPQRAMLAELEELSEIGATSLSAKTVYENVCEN